MKFDIIIVGGGTAGCACAYVAGKLGMKVLIIEKNSFLGGTMTSALVTPAMKTSNNNINNDFFNILMNKLSDLGGQITYPDGNIGWFNPELMKIALDELLTNENITILFDTTVVDIKFNNKNITSIKLDKFNQYNDTVYTNNAKEDNKILSEYIETRYIVDASGDAKIFEKLNLKFLENKNNFQPKNLRFIMSGINLKEFSDWIMKLDKNRDVTTSYRLGNEIHLSTAYTWDTEKDWALSHIIQEGIDERLISPIDLNYFQVFTIPGMPSSLAFNCPRIVDNELVLKDDFFARSEALKQGRAMIYRISIFLKQKFKGFQNAYISSIANSLGVRVSRRIIGKYVYTIDDLRNGTKFENPVLFSNYPVDIHSSKEGKSVLEYVIREYSLPIESLMSADYNNLFAIGRCLSADFESQAALRIIPSCFSMGEGLAKYLAKLDNIQ